MKKSFQFIVLPVAVMVFAGCAGKMVSVKDLSKRDGLMQTITINAPKGLFKAETKNKANTFALQNAAEATIKHGFKYFSIDLPVGISNTHGSLVGNAKEFIKTCNTNSTAKNLGISLLIPLPIVVSINDKCKISNSNGHGIIRIISYKKRPLNFISYDAQSVLDYLKAKKLYYRVPSGEYEEK